MRRAAITMVKCICFLFQEYEITSADLNEDGTVLAVSSNDM